eukprot:1144434-Pelagomonas_calceolata.AAC.3
MEHKAQDALAALMPMCMASRVLSRAAGSSGGQSAELASCTLAPDTQIGRAKEGRGMLAETKEAMSHTRTYACSTLHATLFSPFYSLPMAMAHDYTRGHTRNPCVAWLMAIPEAGMQPFHITPSLPSPPPLSTLFLFKDPCLWQMAWPMTAPDITPSLSGWRLNPYVKHARRIPYLCHTQAFWLKA